MFTLGIDIGSTSSKAVILKDGKIIKAKAAIQIGTGSTGPKRVFEQVVQEANIQLEDISRIIATGYGRQAFEQADSQVSEITCHAKGVYFFQPNARTIIDIGGQDAKTIKVNENGIVTSFVMNDKCAAGTGRFLGVMANVLETEVSELGFLSQRSTNPITISSTCTVFAESEVISRLSAGNLPPDIAAGVHQSVARRVAGLASRAGIQMDVVMTGGVAQNPGVVKALEEQLQVPIIVSPYPQLTGALGAALIAWENILNEK